jgi:2-oxo-4-hydroxy-4-carboxy--5-ureidoimidazoline (OHCU) decarboxylase
MPEQGQDYTCQDYRQEMILLALRARLQKEQDPEQKQALQEEIKSLQQKLGLE